MKTLKVENKLGESMDNENETPSMSKEASELLRRDILSGALPPGKRLRISTLRDEYSLGATPLREALSQLTSEGLVVSLERRGFAVAPVSLKDLSELTDMRKLVEEEALRLSLEHGDVEWESQVIVAAHKLNHIETEIKNGVTGAEAKWEILNRSFHFALVSACPSDRLKNLWDSIYASLLRYRRVCLSLTSSSRDVMAEHEAMVQAALSRNLVELQKLCAEHVDRTAERIKTSGQLD